MVSTYTVAVSEDFFVLHYLLKNKQVPYVIEHHMNHYLKYLYHFYRDNKAFSSHAEHGYCHSVNQHLDACAPCAGKSSWGRTNYLHEDCPGLVQNISSTMTRTPLTKTREFVSPVYTQNAAVM